MANLTGHVIDAAKNCWAASFSQYRFRMSAMGGQVSDDTLQQYTSAYPLDNRDERGATALCMAVLLQEYNSIASLLRAGADPNAPSRYYHVNLVELYPVEIAVLLQDVECIKILAEAGAEVFNDLDGRTGPLSLCREFELLKSFQALVDHCTVTIHQRQLKTFSSITVYKSPACAAGMLAYILPLMDVSCVEHIADQCARCANLPLLLVVLQAHPMRKKGQSQADCLKTNIAVLKRINSSKRSRYEEWFTRASLDYSPLLDYMCRGGYRATASNIRRIVQLLTYRDDRNGNADRIVKSVGLCTLVKHGLDARQTRSLEIALGREGHKINSATRHYIKLLLSLHGHHSVYPMPQSSEEDRNLYRDMCRPDGSPSSLRCAVLMYTMVRNPDEVTALIRHALQHGRGMSPVDHTDVAWTRSLANTTRVIEQVLSISVMPWHRKVHMRTRSALQKAIQTSLLCFKKKSPLPPEIQQEIFQMIMIWDNW